MPKMVTPIFFLAPLHPLYLSLPPPLRCPSRVQFVTRAVRVIKLITNLDMNGFQTHHGLQAFISRLDHEVNICRKEQPFIIRPATTADNATEDAQDAHREGNARRVTRFKYRDANERRECAEGISDLD